MFSVLFGRPHIRLEIVGSTNTYARQLIESGRPQDGTVITSAFQYSGRGQGNHTWESEAGKNLLCSYIFYPQITVNRLFILNKMIACAVHQCLEKFLGSGDLKIKWPNDLLKDNRKVSGMLVETGIKGNEISYCIAGIGINVNQEVFRAYHPEAASIKMLTGKWEEPDLVLAMLNQSMNHWYDKLLCKQDDVVLYFEHNLFCFGLSSEFIIQGKRQLLTITGADNEGNLLMRNSNDEILKLKHGEFQYVL